MAKNKLFTEKGGVFGGKDNVLKTVIESIGAGDFATTIIIPKNSVVLSGMVENELDDIETEQGDGYAKCTVEFTGDAGSVVPKNTSVENSDGLRFETVEEVTIADDETTVEVEAICLAPGEEGNVEIGELNVLPNPVPGIDSVVNTTKGTGGLADPCINLEVGSTSLFEESIDVDQDLKGKAVAVNLSTPLLVEEDTPLVVNVDTGSIKGNLGVGVIILTI